MSAPTAVLTFSYLVVDNYLPAETPEGQQVSFGDRDLLIVDECHKLEDQVASLHAGFTVSPYTLPETVFDDLDRQIGELPDDEVTVFEDIERELQGVATRAQDFIDRNAVQSYFDVEESQDIRDCKAFLRKYNYCLEEIEDGRDWVVDRTELQYDDAIRHGIRVKPVDVDRFLQTHLWGRADKHVLSTATMPFADHPDEWLTRLGLDPDSTQVVQYPMPFPAENRPVHVHTTVGTLSDGGYEDLRVDVVDALARLADQHTGEKGLIHTASYERAQDLFIEFEDNARLHRQYGDDNLSRQIWSWQRSDKDLFFSPAATDGVDLPGEQCRWQVLVKVPYPNLSDSRVRFLTQEREDWAWYMEVTSQSIQQSVGRGVRSADDQCAYYVLDGSFRDVRRRASMPEWFTDAIQQYPIRS
jgi:Rad3-related DNA helicase